MKGNPQMELITRLKSLVTISSLVLDTLSDQDTGWYYQFQAEVQRAVKLVRQIEGA